MLQRTSQLFLCSAAFSAGSSHSRSGSPGAPSIRFVRRVHPVGAQVRGHFRHDVAQHHQIIAGPGMVAPRQKGVEQARFQDLCNGVATDLALLADLA